MSEDYKVVMHEHRHFIEISQPIEIIVVRKGPSPELSAIMICAGMAMAWLFATLFPTLVK